VTDVGHARAAILPTLDFVDLGAGDFGQDLDVVPLLANPVRAGQDRLGDFGQIDLDDGGVLGVGVSLEQRAVGDPVFHGVDAALQGAGVGVAFGDHPLHQRDVRGHVLDDRFLVQGDRTGSGGTLGGITIHTMLNVLFPVQPPLAGLIGNLLVSTLPGGSYLVPATLHPMLMIILSGEIRRELPNGHDLPLPQLGLSGATSRTRRASATPGTQILLASVLPGQLPRLFGLPASAVIEEFFPLVDLLPRPILSELSEKLAASTSLSSRVAHCESFLQTLPVMQVQRASDLVVPEDWLFRPLSDIADAFALSPRQLERRFRQSYGQSLRAFRQQARFSRMLVELVFGRRQFAAWADIATSTGYFDQAHLSRDLRRFTGYAPALLGRQLARGDPALWPYRLSSQQVSLLFGTPVF
jgi:AraC-like DNA-binding protein